MTAGKVQRSRINAACRKLGHPYGNPPGKVAAELLAPYVKEGEKEPRSRKAIYEAALKVLKDDTIKPVRECTPKPKKPKSKKKKDVFYSSWEWKRLRYEALRIHGRRCQCCGWRPGDTEHGYLVVDHIKPRSKYPELELEINNLQVACNDCNMGKSNTWEDDFRSNEDWFARLMADDAPSVTEKRD